MKVYSVIYTETDLINDEAYSELQLFRNHQEAVSSVREIYDEEVANADVIRKQQFNSWFAELETDAFRYFWDINVHEI